MKLKANLHFHSKEDPCDIISYSLFEGIDKAKELGFNVLASTCHTKNIVTAEHKTYAEKNEILLIPGIESNVYEKGTNRKNHVLILNCDESANDIHTFDDLAAYKKEHAEIFIIAAHPYFYGSFSLAERLEKHIDLFDAVELSWFYTRWFNKNPRGAHIAQKYNKPFIATSDTHFFKFMNTNFITVESIEKTPKAFFKAIKNGGFQNTTSPRSLYDIFITFAFWEVKNIIKKIWIKIM
jgi:hypothetical protein